MILRTKVLIVLFLVLLASTVLYFSIFRLVVFQGFIELEQIEARRDVDRCLAAVKREMEHLSVFVNDWSAWDDTYDFIKDGNKEYVESNLVLDTFTANELNLIHFYDLSGNLVWGEIYDLESEEKISLKAFDKDILTQEHPLFEHSSPDSEITTVFLAERFPLILASRPITRSDHSGPIGGVLVMGRFLDDDWVASLSRQVSIVFHYHRLDEKDVQAKFGDMIGRLGGEGTTELVEENESELAGFSLFPDLKGEPALLIHATIPRDISNKGRQTLYLASSFIIGLGFIFLLTIMIALHLLVVRPLGGLTEKVLAIGQSGDLSGSVALDRTDEIGVLSVEFEAMTRKLAQAQSRIVDQSYQSGMAKLATDVMHNVGNVLNTINVSTDVLRQNLKSPAALGLVKALELLDQHKEDLPAFLTADPKGLKLIEYMEKVIRQVQAEQGHNMETVDSLKKSVDHVKTIVSMQQDYATVSGFAVAVTAPELIEDALKINDAGLDRHGIDVIKEYQEVPELMVDKQRVLQILINLIGNAKYSMTETDGGSKRLTLRIERHRGDFVRLSVKDSGAGISPENMTNIFGYGFTTKKKGHGFGLHGAANTATELGGRLTAQSDGPGRGAEFTLEIPIKPGPEGRTS